MLKERIEAVDIYCRKYDICAKWVYQGINVKLVFKYKEVEHKLDFDGVFNELTLKWQIEAAVLKIESFVDRLREDVDEHQT